MTHKFSHSHFRIQTRSQRRREGPRPRRLTKALLPSSRCPMGAYQPHRAPDGAQAEGWCVYARDARQGPDRACFSSWSGSNPRSTSYAHMPKQNLLDVLHDEGSDEVHRFLLPHSVNGSTKGVQRTDTHDDVHNGMVVDSGPSVAENCSCQLFRHFPHRAHVLAINELVEFRDKFGSEIRAVRQRGVLDTTRFGPDVVLSTLCCHADGLPNLLIVKKAHGKTSRHGSSGPLHVHLVSGPDNLEWSSIRHTSLFAEIVHDDGIVRCPTFQGSLGHLSGCLIGLCVPLPQLPHDLRKAVTVLGIWFAHLHVFRTLLKPQVSSAATGSPKVAQSAKQASFFFILLRATVLRERTSQEILGVHL